MQTFGRMILFAAIGAVVVGALAYAAGMALTGRAGWNDYQYAIFTVYRLTPAGMLLGAILGALWAFRRRA